MKKLLLTFLGISLLNVLTAQIDIEFIQSKDVEPGKCYLTQPMDTNTTDMLYFELVPPVFETIYYQTNTKAFEDLMNIDYSSSEPRTLEIKSATTKFANRKIDRYCIGNDATYYSMFSLCNVEIPAEYKTLRKVAVVKGKDTLNVFHPEKIKIQKVVQKGTIRQVSAMEAQKSKNPILITKGSEWTEWREILCPIRCGGNIISNIQSILREKGYYKGYIDGVLGKDLKEALLQFQIDNDLPQGRVDIETLRTLGLK